MGDVMVGGFSIEVDTEEVGEAAGEFELVSEVEEGIGVRGGVDEYESRAALDLLSEEIELEVGGT